MGLPLRRKEREDVDRRLEIYCDQDDSTDLLWMRITHAVSAYKGEIEQREAWHNHTKKKAEEARKIKMTAEEVQEGVEYLLKTLPGYFGRGSVGPPTPIKGLIVRLAALLEDRGPDLLGEAPLPLQDFKRLKLPTIDEQPHLIGSTGAKKGPLVEQQGVPCFQILCAELALILGERHGRFVDILYFLQLLDVPIPGSQERERMLKTLQQSARDGKTWLEQHPQNKRLKTFFEDLEQCWFTDYKRPKAKAEDKGSK